MTRKDYELLATVFGRTRPNLEDFTTTSPDGRNTFVDQIKYTAAYGAWERTIRALSDALEAENPAFDRMRFQYAATGEAAAKVWLVDYRFNVPTSDEALMLAGSAAKRDVPSAEATFIRARQTPKGTWVVTLKRTRA